jgi:hypothetical protein
MYVSSYLYDKARRQAAAEFAHILLLEAIYVSSYLHNKARRQAAAEFAHILRRVRRHMLVLVLVLLLQFATICCGR